MAQRDNKSRRAANQASKIQSKTALAMAKHAATSELKRIFDEEVKRRKSERQHSLSRSGTASGSRS
jgi:hypothetical protein